MKETIWGDLGSEGRMIVKRVWKNRKYGCKIQSLAKGQKLVVGSWENDTKPLCFSFKKQGILLLTKLQLAFQGLSSPDIARITLIKCVVTAPHNPTCKLVTSFTFMQFNPSLVFGIMLLNHSRIETLSQKKISSTFTETHHYGCL